MDTEIKQWVKRKGKMYINNMHTLQLFCELSCLHKVLKRERNRARDRKTEKERGRETERGRKVQYGYMTKSAWIAKHYTY